jgi:hypothetical protein
LSGVQLDNGGFESWGSDNAESAAQVVVALTALEIDPATDARFVKNGDNPVTALLRFHESGGFKHLVDDAVDGMATDQGGYALVAYDRFVKGLSPLYAMADAFEGDPPAPPTPAGDGKIIVSGPDQISNTAGTAFNVTVLTDGWPADEPRLLDGVVNVPEQLAVTDVELGGRLTGGTLTWHLDPTDHKLRFVYTNTALEPIGLVGDGWPALLFTLKLKVTATVNVAATPTLTVAVGGATAKTASDEEAFVFDTTSASQTVGFSAVGVTVRELFTGDGVDLISKDFRAVAVSFSGLAPGSAPAFQSQSLISSPELTATTGVPTFVLVTTPAKTTAQLTNVANYTFPAGTPATVRFGDTDENTLVNAQDALDVISSWLRVTHVTTDQQILRRNVTGDSRINTFDALSVMEHYVSGRAFVVTS